MSKSSDARWQLTELHEPDHAYRRLIGELDALMQSLYPPEANQLTAPEAMFGEGCRVYGCYQGDILCGTVGIVFAEDYIEVKRLYVAPAARGQGLSRRLMGELIGVAAACGYSQIKLETGARQPEALGLYRKLGFQPCTAFGNHADHPASLFLCLSL